MFRFPGCRRFDQVFEEILFTFIFGDEQDELIRNWFCAMNDTVLVLTSFCIVLFREGVPLSVGALPSCFVAVSYVCITEGILHTVVYCYTALVPVFTPKGLMGWS